MSDNKSNIDENSKLLISESEKLQKQIDYLSQKSNSFSIDEIISAYYQVMRVTSIMQFLKQTLLNKNFKKSSIISKKIELTENLIKNSFNVNLHPLFLSYLERNIQETMNNLKSNNDKEKSKEEIEKEAKIYEDLRQKMSAKEFVEQYEKGLSHD